MTRAQERAKLPVNRALLATRVCEQGWSVLEAPEAAGISDRRGREWARRWRAKELMTDRDNQRHRSDLAKLQVHSSARRRGLGAALRHAAEAAPREAGKTLLVLDTVTGSDAERLYTSLG